MSQDSWARAIIESVLMVTFIPAVAYLYARLFGRAIFNSTPWDEGKVYPLLPFKVRVDDAFINRRIRQAVAVCRFNGTPLSLSQVDLVKSLRQANVVFRGMNSLAANILLLVQLAAGGFVAYLFYKHGVDRGWSRENLVKNSQGITVMISLFLVTAQLVFFKREWRRKTADQEAIRSCFYILYLCGKVARGKAKILDVEEAVVELCGELRDFASSAPSFSSQQRKGDVAAHVSHVQQELMRVSGSLLAEGLSGLAKVAEQVGVLTERLIAQRWLCLLDLPGEGVAEPVSPLPDGKVDRKDAWIVLGGSMLAALGLGAAVSMGVPLVAAAPAALVFLLGPATLWGSKRLGISPRNVLDSVRTPVAEANSGGTQPQTNPSSQTGASP
ncbi:hypothetical protein ACIP96_03830 [Streptomyces nigra]|uniref:hypothetical protein n=1 Tax=Streptomyces nigra TaxID=1827580 RepID=UPI00381BA251